MNIGTITQSTDIELCQAWNVAMSGKCFNHIRTSESFLRICQELDNRKITPRILAELLTAGK